MKKTKKHWGIWVVLLFLATGAAVVLTQFRIQKIQVVGNVHYTEAEIIKMVKQHDYVDNSLYMYVKNRLRPIKDIPYIEKLDLEWISPNVVTVTVYEKPMAGCITYMNRYVYFDKDGIVLETSDKKLEDIPCISGLVFDQVLLHEKLPIEDEERFSLILKLTQLLEKYELQVDDIKFTAEGETILFYRQMKILLGKGNGIEEKMLDLGNILESLGDRKGTLDMREFTREKGNASFHVE